MSLLHPGFADLVADSQASFRAVLDAMAHPGRVVSLDAALQPPPPLLPATGAVLLTLIDGDAPLWLAPECLSAGDWIAFHCGATIVTDPAGAAFAIAGTLPDLAAFSSGSDVAPESSATLIVQVAGFGSGTRLRLRGPGLREPSDLAVDGLPRDFAARWAVNAGQYPRGVDLLLCAATTLVALPRSVAVEAA